MHFLEQPLRLFCIAQALTAATATEVQQALQGMMAYAAEQAAAKQQKSAGQGPSQDAR